MVDEARYNISDVSKILGIPKSRVREWSDKFIDYLNLIRDEKTGARLYQQSDIEVLSTIKALYETERYTTEGIKYELNLKRDRELQRADSIAIDKLVEAIKILTEWLENIEKSQLRIEQAVIEIKALPSPPKTKAGDIWDKIKLWWRGVSVHS